SPSTTAGRPSDPATHAVSDPRSGPDTACPAPWIASRGRAVRSASAAGSTPAGLRVGSVRVCAEVKYQESPNISVTRTIYGTHHDDQSIPIPRDTAAARRAHRGGDRLRTGHRARGRDPPCPGGCRRRSRGSEGAG